MQKPDLVQLIKYGIVGVFNTAICLGTIFICKSVLDLNEYLSNMLGYTAGLINSFVWNRTWVFKSSGNPMGEALRFVLGWGVCYAIQLACMWLMLNFTPLSTWQYVFTGDTIGMLAGYTLSGYGIATLIGAVIYTAVNYTYNRIVVFDSHQTC